MLTTERRLERQRRLDFIRSLDGKRLPPLPRRSDTKTINWQALREVECPQCERTWLLEWATDRRWKTCPECRAKMTAPERKTAEFVEFRQLLLSLLTDEWQSTTVLAELLGYTRQQRTETQRVRDTLTRMCGQDLVEGCYMRTYSRGPASRCYRRVQDAQ